MHVMGRLDLLPRRRLAVVTVVILAALAAAAGGSVAVAAGKYAAAAAAAAATSRPWGSYSYGGARAGATVVTPRLAVEDVVAPEFFPVELVGGGQNDHISFPSIDQANRPACSPNCANPAGGGYTIHGCTYRDRCPP
ncbi:hypothetical protein ABZP36_012112 [Zizania latifolia]